jgi:hypothetical protein
MGVGRNIGQRLKRVWGAIVHDQEVLFEVRQLFLGVVIVLVLCYGARAILIQPRQQTLQKKVAQCKEFGDMLAHGEIATMVENQLQQLTIQKKELMDKLAQLRFQKQLYQEQYQGDNAKEQFSNVIFTLLPDSPVDIEGKFLQMSVMDVRSFDHFDVYPVNLQGDANYADFIMYLRYLENRPEVGIISDLVLEQQAMDTEFPAASSGAEKFVDAFSQSVRVHFSLVLGRVELR